MGDTATSFPIFRIRGEVSLWDRLLLICGQKFKTFKILCLLTLWEISGLEEHILTGFEITTTFKSAEWVVPQTPGSSSKPIGGYNLVTPLIHHVSLSLSVLLLNHLPESWMHCEAFPKAFQWMFPKNKYTPSHDHNPLSNTGKLFLQVTGSMPCVFKLHPLSQWCPS